MDIDKIFEVKPSEIKEYKWVSAHNNRLEKEEGFKNSGMWIIYCDRTLLDTLWRIVKRFIESQESAVIIRGVASTFHPDNLRSFEKGAICFYNSHCGEDSDIDKAFNEIDNVIQEQYPSLPKSVAKYKQSPIFGVSSEVNKNLNINLDGEAIYHREIPTF